MNNKLRKIFTSWRVLLVLLLMVMAVIAINPALDSRGVSISHVMQNGTANVAGISSPSQSDPPRNREVIKTMLGTQINTLDDFYEVESQIQNMEPYETVTITTNEDTYYVTLNPIIRYITTNETETVTINETVEVYNEASQTYVNVTEPKNITQNVTIEEVIGIEELGIDVKPAAESNIRKGLDLEGGSRVILEPAEEISAEEFSLLLDNMKERLNVYGLSDVKVVESIDLTGKRFILVEMPGVNEEEVKELIAQQGKFEAKIGNETVFSGGDDIRSVLRSTDRSGIDPRYGCSLLSEELWTCRFYFGIVLSPEAAERQAEVTKDLNVISTDNTTGQVLSRENQYLSKQLDFFLDDSLITSLNIGLDLKGRPVTDIQISGSGEGQTETEARTTALQEMKRLQTVLITGSLPVTLNIVKTDSISASLGQEFLENAIFVGFIALLAVLMVVFIVYRKLSVVIPMMLTIISELVMILGLAAAFRWSLDMAAIAGIIIVIGTGVDHLIIITDETLRQGIQQLSWLQKIKRAFGIILVAGLTTFGAMVPLLFAGAGLLRGFALTTIFGVTIGVLIARPAYSKVLEILVK